MPRRSFRRSRSSRGPVARRDKMWGHFFLPTETDAQDYTDPPGFRVDANTGVIVPIWNNDEASPGAGTPEWHAKYGKEPTLVRMIQQWTAALDATTPAVGTQTAAFLGVSVMQANYDGSSGGLVTMGWEGFINEASRSQNFLYSRLFWLGLPNAVIADWPSMGSTTYYSHFSEGSAQQGSPEDLRAARVIKENELICLWLGMGPYDAAKSTWFNWNAKCLFLTP